MRKLDALIKKADDMALKEVERIARNVLKSSNKTHSFFMAMGVYYFMDKEGEILDYKSKRLDGFMMKYNDMFHLSGNSMRFTVNSAADW